MLNREKFVTERKRKAHLVPFLFSKKFNFMLGFRNPKDFVEFIFEVIEFLVLNEIGKQFRELK